MPESRAESDYPNNDHRNPFADLVLRSVQDIYRPETDSPEGSDFALRALRVFYVNVGCMSRESARERTDAMLRTWDIEDDDDRRYLNSRILISTVMTGVVDERSNLDNQEKSALLREAYAIARQRGLLFKNSHKADSRLARPCSKVMIDEIVLALEARGESPDADPAYLRQIGSVIKEAKLPYFQRRRAIRAAKLMGIRSAGLARGPGGHEHGIGDNDGQADE